MKITTLINIILLASLFLLSPLAAGAQQVSLRPDTPKSVVVEIHQPKITIKSNIADLVNFNISYIDTKDNSTKIIYENGLLDSETNEESITTETAGYYLIDFLSRGIGEITISGSGVYTLHLIIIAIVSIIRLSFWVKHEYF